MNRKSRQWKVVASFNQKERKRLKRILIKEARRKKHDGLVKAARKIAPSKFVPDLGRNANVLLCPKRINISDGYEDTVKFLEKVKVVARGLNGRFLVDFTSAEQVTPAGALMLVAVFDRWRETLPEQRLKAVSLDKWNPDVRRKLKEMGFFDILGSSCDLEDNPPPDVDRYLPFLTGHGSEGDQAQALRKSIESLGPELADSSALYDGLVEAMTNVKQHAYLGGEDVKRWWMSASVNVAKNKLTVMFLDQGAGIPATLPRSRIWEQARGFLAKLGADAFQDDARLIQATLSIERSRTGHDYRGNGLRQDIKGYVETHEARGRLRILSRRGRCIYEKEAGGLERMEVSRLTTPIHGTFLEWTIEEYSSNEVGND